MSLYESCCKISKQEYNWWLQLHEPLFSMQDLMANMKLTYVKLALSVILKFDSNVFNPEQKTKGDIYEFLIRDWGIY